MELIKHKVHDYWIRKLHSGEEFGAKDLKNAYLGIKTNSKGIVELFVDHNRKVNELIGNGYTRATWVRFETILAHLVGFVRHKYQASDLELNKLDYDFISEFEFYLKSKKEIGHNTTIKYVRGMKKIVREAITKGYLNYDPFIAYKASLKEVKREFLSEEEIDAIYHKKMTTERLERVRDAFVFSCYTGLAYSDVQKLTPKDINLGIDGEKWLYTYRKKTGTQVNIPLLPIALEIIEKYKGHPMCDGVLLPVPSNQNTNAFLKEIADICGINKNLTFHMARHTFATTVTLCNNVPIESVSRMLGHKSIKTTQHYGKIIDKKVAGDMAALKQRLSGKGDSKESTDLRKRAN
mgnify:CR=1 FL=1